MAKQRTSPRRSRSNLMFALSINGPRPPLYRSPIDCLRPGRGGSGGVIITSPEASGITGDTSRFTPFFPGPNR